MKGVSNMERSVQFGVKKKEFLSEVKTIIMLQAFKVAAFNTETSTQNTKGRRRRAIGLRKLQGKPSPSYYYYSYL